MGPTNHITMRYCIDNESNSLIYGGGSYPTLRIALGSNVPHGLPTGFYYGDLPSKGQWTYAIAMHSVVDQRQHTVQVVPHSCRISMPVGSLDAPAMCTWMHYNHATAIEVSRACIAGVFALCRANGWTCSIALALDGFDV